MNTTGGNAGDSGVTVGPYVNLTTRGQNISNMLWVLQKLGSTASFHAWHEFGVHYAYMIDVVS